MEHPAEQAVTSARDAIANVPARMVGPAGLGAGGEGKKGNSSRSCQQRLVGHWEPQRDLDRDHKTGTCPRAWARRTSVHGEGSAIAKASRTPVICVLAPRRNDIILARSTIDRQVQTSSTVNTEKNSGRGHRPRPRISAPSSRDDTAGNRVRGTVICRRFSKPLIKQRRGPLAPFAFTAGGV